MPDGEPADGKEVNRPRALIELLQILGRLALNAEHHAFNHAGRCGVIGNAERERPRNPSPAFERRRLDA